TTSSDDIASKSHTEDTPSPSNPSNSLINKDTHCDVPPAYDSTDNSSDNAAHQSEDATLAKLEETTDASPSTSDDNGIPAILAIVGTIVHEDFIMCFFSSMFELAKTKFKFTLRQPDMYIPASKLLSPGDIDLISSFQRDWPIVLEHTILRRPLSSRIEVRYKPFVKYGDFDISSTVYNCFQPQPSDASIDPHYILGHIEPDGMGFEKFTAIGKSVTADELDFSSSSSLDNIPLFTPHATWCLPGDPRTCKQLDSTTGHIVHPPPAFDLAGNFIPLHRLYNTLIGSTVEVRFELLHFKIKEGNDKHSDTFTTNIVSICMLAPKSPDFNIDLQGGPSTPSSPRKRSGNSSNSGSPSKCINMKNVKPLSK
ncbi:hypothetical protein FISHEDRAFT_62964, partial [Fistulina hepatica ATCC 64428]